MTQDEIIRMALEALSELSDAYRMDINSEFETHANPDPGGNAKEYKNAVVAITALREALAEQAMQTLSDFHQMMEQEPVGEMINHAWNENMVVPFIKQSLPVGTKLYAAPQPVNQEPVEEWAGQSNIESPFNACQHKSYCCQLKNAAPVRTKDLKELLDVMVGMANYIDKLGGDSKKYRAVIAAYKEKNK